MPGSRRPPRCRPGVPETPSGIFEAHSSRALSVIARVMSVSISPGATTLTVMPARGDFERHAPCVNPIRPGLRRRVVRLAGVAPLADDRADADDPAARAARTIGLSTACVSVKAAVRFVASTASQSSRFIRSINWSRVIPALFTRMSIRPCRSSTDADHLLDRSRLGHVERDRLRPARRGRDLFRDAARVVAARGCNDVGPLGGKSQRNRRGRCPARRPSRSRCGPKDQSYL